MPSVSPSMFGTILHRSNYSTVYQGTWRNQDVIIKCVPRSNIKAEFYALNECDILKKLATKFPKEYNGFMHLLHEYQLDAFHVMILQKGGQDLFDFYIKIPDISQRVPLLQKHIYHALKIISELHEMGMTHNDVKPENLVMISNKDEEVAFIDFGFSLEVDAQSECHVNVPQKSCILDNDVF